jgi:Ca2+-binding RTX toxin-like protein
MVMKEAIQELETPKIQSVTSNRALDGWGNLDVLSNIEAATGSNFNDQLYGSNSRNILIGNDGFDFISGNGGDDYIVGGFGHDFLQGGLGRDWLVMDELNWGNLKQTGSNTTYNYSGRFVRDNEQSGNMVSYKTVNESTASNPDITDGFVPGDDLIDLTAIDANTLRSGNQQFNENIVTAFTKKAGQLKVSQFTNLVDSHNYSVSNADGGYKLSGTELQGDVNGDGVADFSVKIVGVSYNPTVLNDSILF